MGKILEAVLIIFAIVLLGFSFYFLYLNLPGSPVSLNITQFSQAKELPRVIASSEITQFIPNLRFNHNNISYYFSASCNSERRARIEQAFSVIKEDTVIISFEQFNDLSDADITISCSEAEVQKSENLFIAGEGGPKEYVNSTIYPIILRGNIYLYKQSSCKEPIVELHELLHVFGFDHINNSDYIMYPVVNCDQKLSQGYVQYLINLYSAEPLADVYFEYANITKSGRYLNFEVFVSNRGMIDEENATLLVYSENENIGEFSLGKISFGGGKRFYVQNFRLPSRFMQDIQFRISTPDSQMTSEGKTLNASLG